MLCTHLSPFQAIPVLQSFWWEDFWSYGSRAPVVSQVVIKVVLSSLCIPLCAMAGMYRFCKLGSEWKRSGTGKMCKKVTYPVSSVEPRDRLDYCTTLVAQQIVPFVKSGFFNQWQLLCDFSGRGAKHTPLPSPPPFSAPSLFCLVYF